MNLYIQMEEVGNIEILPVNGFILKKDFDTQSYKLIAKQDDKNIVIKDFGSNKAIANKYISDIFNDIKNAGVTGRTSFIWDFKNI